MNIEKQPSLPYSSVLGSQLKLGKVYMHQRDVDVKEPKLYQVCNYDQQNKTFTDLNTGHLFSVDPDGKFIEVKAKVVWEHVL